MKSVFKIFTLFFAISVLVIACKKEENNPCDGVVCSTGEICDNGDCVDDPDFVAPCDTIQCEAWEICTDGSCVNNPNFEPCDTITCNAGEVCENGTCVPDNQNSCEACKTYDGNVNSGGDSITLLIGAGVGIDNEILTDKPFVADVTENSLSSDSLDIDVSMEVEISGLAVVVPISITVFYNENTGEFQAQKNRDYTIVVTNPISLNIEVKVVDFFGTINTTNGTIDGELILDDPDGSTDDDIDATLYFTATEQ